MFSKFFNKKFSKKDSSKVPKPAVPLEWKTKMGEHGISLSRVCPYDVYVTKRRSKNNAQTDYTELYCRLYPLPEVDPFPRQVPRLSRSAPTATASHPTSRNHRERKTPALLARRRSSCGGSSMAGTAGTSRPATLRL
jgi:hypothetical protein